VEAQFSLGIFPRTGTLLLVCICGVVGLALIIGLAVFMTRRSKAT
jgi:ABC-type phosphate transport system permease subunit